MRLTTLTLVILTSAEAAHADDAWNLLAMAEFTEVGSGQDWRVEKTFPEALVAARDDFEIEGYFVPVEAQPYITMFILVSEPGDCPFCGGAGYGPVLEVKTKRAMPDMDEFSLIRVRGQLELIEDPETTQLFRLTEARLVN